MEENKQLVIVLSRVHATGLSVIRSLGAAGYTVDLVASSPRKGASSIAASSKYVRNAVEVVSRKVKNGHDEGEGPLVEALLKYAGQNEQKPVLFPTDDYTASVADRNRSILEPHFLMPHIVGGGDGSLTERMDKVYQADLAEKAGLKIPQEWIISLRGELKIPDDMIYPCFCKPLESVSGFKSEMAKCETEEELQHHLKKLKKKFSDRSILIQEFLQIDNEIDLSGVCLDQKIIIPAVIQKTRVAEHEKGVTMAGNVVSTEVIAPVLEKMITMLKQLHYVGMFDMELNVVGDSIYFNEVNLRSGGPNYAYFASGINLPALVVKELTGQEHTAQEEQATQLNKSFVYERMAWMDYIHGHISKKEMNEIIRSADITLLYNDEDKAPENRFKIRIRLTALKAKWKKIKKLIRKWVRPYLVQVYYFVKRHVWRYPQVMKKNRRNPSAEKPRVLISGRNYCSNLCLARSFGEAGYETEILRIFQTRPSLMKCLLPYAPDAYSKYIKAFHECITHRKSRRLVNRLIELADPNRKMLLIPADDLVACIVDENMDVLREYYEVPSIGGQQGEISRLMSKEIQTEMAAAAGLPVINSCVIRTECGEFEIPESVTYPCFIKPNISKNSSKSKMKRCDSEQELRDTLEEYTQHKDVEMLVEDFVDIKKEYAILGLSTRDGVVAPGFFGAEEGGHGPRRGVTMIGKVLPTSCQQKLIDDICKFVASLNYEGLFDVDLIETEEGKIYFVELNLRYGASGYAITRCGANLPGMFADYMLQGKPIDLNCTVAQTGKTFISEKVSREEYIDCLLTKAELDRKMDSVDIHFVKNEEDPQAYRHFRMMYPLVLLQRVSFRLTEWKAQRSGEK